MCENSSELADQSSDSLFNGSRYVVISSYMEWNIQTFGGEKNSLILESSFFEIACC